MEVVGLLLELCKRPMEASCKKPVGRLREVVQIPKKVSLMKLMLFFCEIFVLFY